MRRGIRIVVVTIAAIAAVLASCAPQPAPAPKPTATAPTQAPTSSGTTAAPGPQSDWDKVVQAAKKEGKLNFYNWYFTEGRGGQALAQDFEARYGIKLEAVQGRGAEFIERLKTEQRIGQMTGDVVEGSSLHLENMRLAGLLTPSLDLPVFQEKDVWYMVPNYQNKEGYYLNYQRMFLTMFMNTNLVKPGEEPKGLMDLLNPKWKGKLIISDPVVSEIASRFALYIQQKRLPEDFPTRLGQQELLFDPSTPGEALKLAQGNASIAVLLATLDVSNLVAEGAPLRILDIKEGTMVDALAIGAVKNGPHPNAAKVFINYILSTEGQKFIADKSLSYPVRKGITANVPPAMQLEPSNPLLIDPAAVEFVAKVFREKQLVPALKPK